MKPWKTFCPYCEADITSVVYTTSWETNECKFHCPKCNKKVYRAVSRAGRVGVYKYNPNVAMIILFVVLLLAFIAFFLIHWLINKGAV